MLDWTDEHKMLRDAIREFVQKEIVPLHTELEHGDLPPYDVLRKLFARSASTQLLGEAWRQPDPSLQLQLAIRLRRVVRA